MSIYVREHLRFGEDVTRQQDSNVRDDVRGSLAQLNILTPDNHISEVKKKDSTIALSPGEFGGFALENVDTYDFC